MTRRLLLSFRISTVSEYIDKDDLIKKIVSMEFGKFLAYYADAPELEKVVPTKEKKPQSDKQKLQNKAAKGYKRLFIARRWDISTC